jgi:hypothetical protein
MDVPAELVLEELKNSASGRVQLEIASQRVIIAKQQEEIHRLTMEIEQLLQESKTDDK